MISNMFAATAAGRRTGVPSRFALRYSPLGRPGGRTGVPSRFALRYSPLGRPGGLMALGCAYLCVVATGPAAAHGVVGKRFFPATLTTEDPFVADELSLPTISRIKMGANGDEPATRETAFSVDVTKRVTENFAVGFGASYLRLQPSGEATQHGFDNLEAGVKYQFYQNAERESIVSVGVDWDIGGSGSKKVGAESFSTITPALFFGKGFGDLPEDAKYLRPLALTGQLGIGLPTRASTTTTGATARSASKEIHTRCNGDSPSNTAFPICSRSSRMWGFPRRSTG